MSFRFIVMLGVYCIGIATLLKWLNRLIYKVWPDWDEDDFVPNDLSEDYVPERTYDQCHSAK